MPYIKPEMRPPLDRVLEPLIHELITAPDNEVDGMLNYSITRILHDVYSPSYYNYNRALGVLEAIKLEFYRRSVAAYEDLKAQLNGDVL
jgi:hypothetical protein